MRLHFPSVAVGIAALSVVLVSMSQSGPGVAAPRIEYGPNPRDMVQVHQGTPYVVPAGKLFVLTGLGAADGLNASALAVDGVTQAGVQTTCSNGGGSTVAPVPPGFTVAAGSVITVFTFSSGQARAWGYLANQ